MKRFWIGCLALVCVFSLCSCGNNSANGDSAATIASLEQEITELQERIAELEEENGNLRAGGGNTVNDNTSTNSNIETPPINLELNMASTVGDVMDITITGAEWSDSVLPSDTSKSYSYYEDKENETSYQIQEEKARWQPFKNRGEVIKLPSPKAMTMPASGSASI